MGEMIITRVEEFFKVFCFETIFF